MARARPYVLALGGFDPSGGAGVLADVKTLEMLKVYGLAVPTALTWQNDVAFQHVQWMAVEAMQQQADLLFDRFKIRCVKIGLIESWAVLAEMILYCKRKDPHVQITLDPVLKATAGFAFHDAAVVEVTAVLPHCRLITPNREEMMQLVPGIPPMEGAQQLSQHCAVLLKGGHDAHDPGRDYLFVEGHQYAFRPKRTDGTAKHGSGCVLAAAITAYLAAGYRLPRACLKGKDYVTRVLCSNPTLLGYHKR